MQFTSIEIILIYLYQLIYKQFNPIRKMKKIYFISVLCLIVSLQAWGQKVTVNGIEYELAGEIATVSYTTIGQYSGDIIIPQTIEYESKTYTVTSVKANTFGWSPTVTSVLLPNTIVTIGNHAFYGGNTLTSVNIPDGVETIGNYAFGQNKMMEFDIPRSVKSIGKGAFESNQSLAKNVIVHWENPDEVTLDDLVFQVTNLRGLLFVPPGTENLYKAADQWKDFSNIQAITGIRDIELLGINIYTTAGELIVDNVENNLVSVYNMQGQNVASVKASASTLRLPLPVGTYVVHIKGAAQKVVVK